MEFARGLALVTATITVGLTAGAFFIYAVAVMPGLGRTSDRIFVAAFQAIDRAIINPVFLSAFFGALVLSALASLLHLRDGSRWVAAWAIAATVLYLIVLLITIRVNVPLNDAIKAAGNPDHIDVAAVRARFDEVRWGRWNVVRTVLNLAALACMSWAAVLSGRPLG